MGPALRRTGLLLGLGLGLVGCRPEPTTTPTQTGNSPPVETTTPTEPEPEPAACTPTDAFDDHAWAPAESPAVASIALDHPELPEALHALAEHTRGEGHGLPIPLAFSLSQWSWQVPALVATLRQAGFAPAELVFVAGDPSDHAWVWRSACDLDAALETIGDRWRVRSRTVVEGVIASPLPPDEPDGVAFPYDVLVLPGDRFALVPAGQAATTLQRWDRPAPTTALGSPAPGPGDRLDALAPAPIRLVVRGHALVDPSTTTAPDETRSLRITASGVETTTGDASLDGLP